MLNHEFEQSLLTPACRIEHYSYKHPFSTKRALEDINLEVSQGDFVVIFGDSGSGKTTLFSSLAGFNHYFFKGGRHEGKIELFGNDVASTEISALTRDYGIVFQNFRNQLMASEVEQAIAFPLENIGVKSEEMHQRVNSLLSFMGISELKDREVNGLSGGEGQAVVVASMLAKDPKLMIFDDISSDLDQNGQERIKKIMKALQEKGVTLIVADSSCPKWLLEQANKALIIKEGRQIFSGNPQEIRNNQILAQEAGIVIPRVEFREPGNSPVAVSAESVCFAYNDKLAVNNVSVEIHKGSVTGIIGHNGSGKTTLAKILAGIYRPKSGRVRLESSEPFLTPANERVLDIAYLYQNPGDTFFTSTVRDELGFTPKAAGVSCCVSPAEIGLANLDDEHPKSLSTGQQQRLALGCALSTDPKILIFDEPTKGLNQQERLALTEQIKALQAQGKTIIIISHDWPMIARTTNQVVVMNHGRLVREGATREVMQDKSFFNNLGLALPW
jgi:energy-coupling factor transport system ATP-binding protein